MRGCSRTRAARASEIALPVSAPFACDTRRTECPPSRPSPSSNSTPASTRSAIRAGASSVSTRTALSRQRPRPARSVSSACSSGESSSASDAATPPCACQLFDPATGPLTSRRTSASEAADSAATSPATPPPTTSRSTANEVFSSKSITCTRVYMVSDPKAKTSTPFHAVLAVVLQVRDGRLQVLLWERALDPCRGSWSLPGGTLAEGETLEQSIRRHLETKVDVRELSHLEQLETRSEPDRHP